MNHGCWQIKAQAEEEIEIAKRVLNVELDNIVDKRRSELLANAGPLSETTPFPADAARELAAMSDEEAALYGEAGTTP